MEQNLIIDISKLTKKLLMKDAFYGLFLSTINKKEDRSIPTAAVSLNKSTMDFTLLINPEWWFKFADNVRYGILSHEVRHLTNFHLIMSDLYPNQDMANIAMDCEINQTIDRANLPDDGIFLDELRAKHPKLDWKSLAGAKHYYNELGKLPEEEKKKIGISGNSKHTWIITDRDGNKVDASKLTESEKDAIRVQIEATIEQLAEEMSKSNGNIPNEISKMISGFVKPKPKFNYAKYIKNFVGNSTRYMISKTKLRENQRFENAPKVVLKPINRVLCLVDESGSVSENELYDFLNEIHHLSKKTDIEIRPFDTEVMSPVKYSGKGSFERTNCGGTSFTAAVDFYNQNREFQSCIIFTDGHAEVPPKCNKRLLWVISSNGSTYSIKDHATYIKIPI